MSMLRFISINNPFSYVNSICAILCTAFLLMDMFPIAAQELAQVNDKMKFSDSDWPWWRGPARNGTAASDQTPPTQWSDSENIVWKVAIPGRGHGSTCIVGERIFLQTAEEETGAQLVLCVDRTSGKELWKTVVHASGGMKKNQRSTAASSTPACDGERLFVNFPNNGALITTSIGIDGQILWQSKISDYIEHQGYGSSPAIYQSLVITTSDNKGGGAITALNRTNGEIIWTRDRPKQPNYPSPIIVHASGRDQIVLTGCDKVSSFEPLTGKTLWEIDGATTECVTSTVTDGKRVFTSGGYPRNHMSAIAADGSGKVEWENNTRLYVPSLLMRNGFLFGTLDAGIAACWASDTGKELWKNRLSGNFSASPVLVGETIFATNEAGDTFVYKANEKAYEEIARNHLGDEVFATPVICDSKIYYRAATLTDGKRQEFLYCIGKK